MKPVIGVSACLLGEPVRFNGGHKKHAWISETLNQVVNLRSFCPEIGIGLSTPRPALRLIATDQGTAAVDSDTQTKNVTEKLLNYHERHAQDFQQLDGFVLMQGSPSCGMERVKVYGQGAIPEKTGVGIFAQSLMQNHPGLPIEEAGRLNDAAIAESFLSRLYVYSEWRTSQPFQSAAELIRFHSKHKFLIMLHDYQGYRETGRLLANLADEKNRQKISQQYIQRVMQALTKRSSRGHRANALLHLFGFVKTYLNQEEKHSILSTITRYRHEQLPYVVPINLLRHYASLHKNDDRYLDQQSVWQPYPEQLTAYKNIL